MENSFVEKHRPQHPDDVVGHPTAIKKIKRWARNWSDGDNPLLLHGPAGTGKTSTAEAIANYADWGYNEINASEYRRKEDIQTLVQEIRSRYENRTLFLLDEVDSIRGSSLQSLYKVLDDSPNPIICTANESWKVPDGLENRCTKHKFNLQDRSIKNFLRDVADEEGISITSRELGQLATRNGLRDALNDLQEYKESGKTDWDTRETDDSPFAVTRRILQNKNYIGDMNPDDKVAFLNENIKNEFDGIEAMRAYQAISEADEWLGLVNRTQDYTWWRYAGSIAEEVANLRNTEPYGDWLNVDYPTSRYNRTPSPQSDSPEAELYNQFRQSKSHVTFNFHEFRQVILPLLRGLPKEEKMQLVLSHSLTEEALDCLDITQSEYEDWVGEEKESTPNETNSDLSDFLEEDGEIDESDEQSIFNY